MRLWLLLCLVLAGGLVLPGCAQTNNEEDATNDLIEIRITFADRVNPDQFFYYLVFNFDDDTNHIPLDSLDVFQNHTTDIGRFWDIYYLYGRPGLPDAPLPANFFKGFGGNEITQTDLPPRKDSTNTRYIDILPQRPFDSSALEFLQATVTNGATNPANPNDNVLTGNTILYRFRAANFPNAPFTLLRNGKAKLSILVANQGIDDVSNPDDDIDDCVIYDRFRESVVRIDLTQKPKWSEETDPQENIEENRLPRNPPLEGPFKAADLVNWSVELIKT
ncbi:MAG: hypothetical protein ABI743_10985 [bacterium]